MKKIDALDKVCPAPIIMAKQALKENDAVEILVDDDMAPENLKKLADQKKYDYNVENGDNGQFTVTLKKTDKTVEGDVPINGFNEQGESYIVVINTDTMGHGDETLGKNLLHGFVYSLTEQDVLPDKILCYNGGVHLVTEGSDYLTDLKALEEGGVEIQACGACLDYFGLKDKVAVGSVTNMFNIVETMRKHNRIVRPD
ncbi:sulfurtransferase-like selenium metabolism protein YedF [Companilactobacillus mishanensis]|uniref:Sulfurtransferase-like selenium metabolism protein YedF n=1 Tax=Companilactobacillus mishanensis TaxID=2486008 RepID=A0A5P0ZH41_9LACO|nr:sulfurtransferase-like selenium metabolism protein YedF [Companilactobacillus mishanensis]MQS44944.1 sulfurtransferase-like selenium metabolism protein YedF [Companilactobacillus mishanensis]MQS52377.1 sulfurtransferase-like selenium metabolism protein YedF [Companilactobacillus mishanensis]MQS89459.1 sulfurtransferase-like selenium metabolism protein YedF [Companilactobacillus mishanensis]